MLSRFNIMIIAAVIKKFSLKYWVFVRIESSCFDIRGIAKEKYILS